MQVAWHDQGIAPKVVLRLSSLGVVESIVATTDCLAIVPSRIPVGFKDFGRVRSADLPFPASRFEVRLHWRDHGDATQEAPWFRSVIREASGAAQGGFRNVPTCLRPGH